MAGATGAVRPGIRGLTGAGGGLWLGGMGPIGQGWRAAGSFRRRGVAAILCLLSAAAGTGTGASRAGAVVDCAPLARPAGFRAVQDAELRAYDAIEFTVLRNGHPATEVVAGSQCYQVYVPEDGAGSPVLPDLHARYRDRLAEIGAQILFADTHRIHARLIRAGRETWLRINVQDYEIDVTVLDKQPLTPTLTRPTGRDHRLIGRMPHYDAGAVEKHADAVRTFAVQSGNQTRSVEIRGAVTEIAYQAKSRAMLSSDLEIQENYRIALRARGADILFTDWRTTVARVLDRGRMIWVRVTSQVSDIAVLVVEAKLPSPGRPLGDPALRATLDREGRATLASGLPVGASGRTQVDQGIVRQVARLMRRDRNSTAAVIVHTDDLGDRAANLERSRALAEAIVGAIVKQGIAPGRMTAVGAGPDRPVADNATVEGRAQNRRVELVREQPSPPPAPPRRPGQ